LQLDLLVGGGGGGKCGYASHWRTQIHHPSGQPMIAS